VIEKYEARTMKQQIRKVLLEVWDPIGINHIPEAFDEYESYVNEVYEWLRDGLSDQRIAEELFYIASETMGLDGLTVDQMLPTVAALRAIPFPKNIG
jgi:hypothetical protein